MKPENRDNIIYLTVGITIAVLLVAQFFYADSHEGRTIFHLSTFLFRAVTSTLLIGYFVGREVSKVNATIAEIVQCVVSACVLQLAINYAFRVYIEQLSIMSYVVLMALEFLFIVSIATWANSHFGSRSGDR